jgi:hypothetical protein
LLECKNFGVTSLSEVRSKLAFHGLSLQGDTWQPLSSHSARPKGIPRCVGS